MTRVRPDPGLPVILPIYDAGATAAPLQEVFEALARGGARWVQYRDKTASDRDFLKRARAAREAAGELGLTLMVNDRVAVAAALGVGVHLGQQDLPASVARRLLGEGVPIGLSTDTLRQVETAGREPVDYVAVGPIFETPTKADAGGAVGLDAVRAARDRLELPLVAIGGIDAGRARDVTAAGADCVAVVSAILDAEDMVAATRRIREEAEGGRADRGV